MFKTCLGSQLETANSASRDQRPLERELNSSRQLPRETVVSLAATSPAPSFLGEKPLCRARMENHDDDFYRAYRLLLE